MKNRVDIKSIITLSLVGALIFVTVAMLAAVIFGVIKTDDQLANAIILLFSNSTTMVMTYFFSRKSEEGEKK